MILTGGDARSGNGGAIHSDLASLTVRDSVITGNVAAVGGGIYAKHLGTEPGAEIKIIDSTLSGNTINDYQKEGGGGAFISVNNSLVEIRGTTISNNGGPTIGNNYGASAGGGLIVRLAGELPDPALETDTEFRLIESTIAENMALFKGGGLFFQATGGADVEVRSSTITGNEVTLPPNEGGGVYGFSLKGNETPARATISNTTISGNQALTEGAGMFFCTKDSASLTIENSTISGNHDGGGGMGVLKGGGLYLAATDPGNPNPALSVTITNVTIAENVSGLPDNGKVRGGGVWTYEDEPEWVDLKLDNTIISGNRDVGGSPSDIGGEDVLASSAYNLIGSGGSGGLTDGGPLGNIVGEDDPKLFPLASNGGPTLTHALFFDSLAIDAGNPGFTSPPDTDQRGVPFDRVEGSHVDIGAYELTGGGDPYYPGGPGDPGDYPRVTAVIVSGSGSSHAHYSIPAVAGEQLRTVPVGSADSITVWFDREVVVENDDLMLAGYLTGQFTPNPANFSSGTNWATWQFDDPLPGDMMELTLKDTVTEVVPVGQTAHKLDGNWTDNFGGPDEFGNPYTIFDENAAQFPSGDNTEGGDFVFRFTILPGDANRDNVVGAADFKTMRRRHEPSEMLGGFRFEDGDFDGDGKVTNDLDYKGQYGFKQYAHTIFVMWGRPLFVGDMDIDLDVDFDDIDDLVEALNDLVDQYIESHRAEFTFDGHTVSDEIIALIVQEALADVDDDGDLDFDDINPAVEFNFIRLLQGGLDNFFPSDL